MSDFQSNFSQNKEQYCLQSLFESDVCDETGKNVQSPLSIVRKKHHHVLTPRQSERNLGVTESSHSLPLKVPPSRFQIGGLGMKNSDDV